MASLNHTQALSYILVKCGKSCLIRFASKTGYLSVSDKIYACLVLCNSLPNRPYVDRDYNNMGKDSDIGYVSPERTVSSTTLSPKTPSQRNPNDEILHFVAFYILLPIVLVLIAICFVLGVVLVVKSYMMMPLKQNLATAIRRRRRVGHAPENNYIPPAEMRASQRMSSSTDRKSLPPPEVLLAARERASQLHGGANFI